MLNTILRILVGILLIAGLIFLILSLTNGRSTDYLTISLGLIAAGNFLNLFTMYREKKSLKK